MTFNFNSISITPKKTILFLSLLFLIQPVFATENKPEQTIENNQTYFTTNIQKQPQQNGSKQGIKNHFSFFTINVNVNGKVENFYPPERQ